MFIRNNIQFSEIVIEEKTIVECQVTRIKLGETYYCIINVYIPPYKTRLIMVNELSSIIRKLRQDFESDEFIMIGDFNMPHPNKEMRQILRFDFRQEHGQLYSHLTIIIRLH